MDSLTECPALHDEAEVLANASLSHCITGEMIDVVEVRRPAESLLTSCTVMAALLHDLGKAFDWFQWKLRQGKPIADPLRHELLSFGVVNALVKATGREGDGWLDDLADPSKAAGLIEVAFRDFSADPLPYMFPKVEPREGNPLAKAFTLADDDRLLGMNSGAIGKAPKLAMVGAIILSHHRLPGGSVNKSGLAMTAANLLSSFRPENAPKKDLSCLWGLPKKAKGLWTSAGWVNEVTEWAAALRDAEVSDPHRDFRVASVYGRTAVIIGDHRASMEGNRRVAAITNGVLFANTSSVQLGALAEPLDEHLISVGRQVRMAIDLLLDQKGILPAVEGDLIPETIRNPQADKGSRYRWQFDSAKVTRDAVAASSGNSGFFGVLMAGTGSGKTRAAPIILTAASGDDPTLRFVMASGLRALTLQGGDAYRRELRFRPEDVSVVIGDSLVAELHETRQRESIAGTDAEMSDAYIVATQGGGTPYLPPRFDRFFDKEGILPAPVLVSTIDTLMSVADARRGRHVEAMMRVATSDLVVDEIDDFGEEDIQAISRLAWLTGLFGRRLIVSSATISPVIASEMYRAYSEGWSLHAASFGKNPSVDVGWYSEVEESSRVHQVAGLEDFSERHLAFARDLVDGISAIPSRRRAAFPVIGETSSAEDFFAKVAVVMKEAHRLNHVVDDRSGKRLSLGVVKWNNVLPAMLHAGNLLDKGVDGMSVKVVPYNGTLLPVVREKVERTLEGLLTRKGSEDPVLSHPLIREFLDDSATGQDVTVVVVTTSMEEVGRDHDFDWAVVDPGSHRSLVQMAGRVRRHRYGEWTATNVFILDLPFKAHRQDWAGAARQGIYAFPGIETPLPIEVAAKKEFRKVHELPDKRAESIYGKGKVEARIDASDIIMPGPDASALSTVERNRVSNCLVKGFGEPLSVRDFTQQPFASVTDFHSRNRRFRRRSGEEYVFEFRNTDYGECWYVAKVEGKGTAAPSKQNDLMSEIECDRAAILIPVGDLGHEVDDLLARMGRPGEGATSWRARALCTIRRSAHDLGRKRFVFNPALGLCDSKGLL